MFFKIIFFLCSLKPILVATSSCDRVKNKIFDRICIGTYPNYILYKYHDGIVKYLDPYAIFKQRDSSEGYFVAHIERRLHSCKSITMHGGPQDFTCRHSEDSKDEKIQLNSSAHIHCLWFHFQLVVDLVNYCMNDGKSDEHVENPNITLSILHYPIGGKSGALKKNINFNFVYFLLLLTSMLCLWN